MTRRIPPGLAALLCAAFAGPAALAQDPAAQSGMRVKQSRSAAVAPAAAETGAAPIAFIDAHVHLNDVATADALMPRYGVQQAVALWGRDSDNASVAATAAAHPERYVAFASISPEREAYRDAWRTGAAGTLTYLDGLLATGRYRGIGELSIAHFPSPGFPETDFDPDGAMARGVMDLARKYKVPVMVHVEITRIQALSALLDRYPDVAVIWAHGGYTPLFLARRMLERHPSLYYELSARTWPRHPRSPEYTILQDGERVWPEWLALIEAMPARFVVGTDASFRAGGREAMKYASVQNFLRQLGPAARERVAVRNMQQLLGLPGASAAAAK